MEKKFLRVILLYGTPERIPAIKFRGFTTEMCFEIVNIPTRPSGAVSKHGGLNRISLRFSYLNQNLNIR